MLLISQHDEKCFWVELIFLKILEISLYRSIANILVKCTKQIYLMVLLEFMKINFVILNLKKISKITAYIFVKKTYQQNYLLI